MDALPPELHKGKRDIVLKGHESLLHTNLLPTKLPPSPRLTTSHRKLFHLLTESSSSMNR